MALLVMLALAGAFGDGPLSRATVHQPDGSTIALNRVMRAESPERVLISASAGASPVTLSLDSTTLRWLTIESTVPGATAARRGTSHMELDVTPSRDGTVAVELVVTPHVIGAQTLRARLGDGVWSDVRVVVLP